MCPREGSIIFFVQKGKQTIKITTLFFFNSFDFGEKLSDKLESSENKIIQETKSLGGFRQPTTIALKLLYFKYNFFKYISASLRLLIICIKDDGTIFHHSLKGDKFAFYISRPRKAVRRLLFFSRTQVIVSTTKTKSLFNLFWLQRNQVLLLSSQLHDFLKKTSNELVSSEPAVNQWWTRSEMSSTH